jgi:hypothetical protein
MGVAINNIDSEKIAEANDALDRVGSAVQGLGNMIAVTLSPYLTLIADQFVDWAKEGSVASKIVATAVEATTSVIGYLADAVQIVTTGWHLFSAGALEAVSLALTGIDKLIEAFTALSNKIFGTNLQATAFFKDWAGTFEAAAVKSIEKADAAWARPWAHEGVRKFVQDIEIKAGERAKLAAGKEAAFRAPGAGIMGGKPTEYKTAGAFEAGSVAAYSAIVQARGAQAGVQNSIEKNTRRGADASERTAIAIERQQNAAGGGADGEQFRRQHAGV